MKKVFSILVMTSILMLAGCSSSKKEESSNEIKNIGIIQIAEHGALTAAREGFIAGLEEAGMKEGVDFVIDYKNAGGDQTSANTIAQGFAADQKDLIFAIATPSALASMNASTTIPIVFSAVTDPVEAKLVDSIDKPGRNLTGTSDNIDMSKQFELIQLFVPEAKTVGMIYNTSETNSIIQINNAKEVAKTLNMTVEVVGVTSSNEIAAATKTILEKSDVLLIPTDNLIADAMPTVVDAANTAKKVVIGSEGSQVEAGALATNGISYFELGKQSAAMAVKILNGSAPETMAVQFQEDTTITLNETTLKALGLEIPTTIDQSKLIIVK